MIIMSVDLGKARTGVAVSDSGEEFAFPKEVITEYNPEKLIDKLCVSAKNYSARLIVVGLPKNMDGTMGIRAEECMAAAAELERKSGIKTVLWDERCTTVSAHSLLDMNEKYGKKRKQIIDAVSAVIILEDYLAARKNKR